MQWPRKSAKPTKPNVAPSSSNSWTQPGKNEWVPVIFAGYRQKSQEPDRIWFACESLFVGKRPWQARPSRPTGSPVPPKKSPTDGRPGGDEQSLHGPCRQPPVPLTPDDAARSATCRPSTEVRESRSDRSATGTGTARAHPTGPPRWSDQTGDRHDGWCRGRAMAPPRLVAVQQPQ